MSWRRRYHERQRCPDCGRFLATLVPWHGDGSLVRFVTHGPIAARCTGSREVPPGDQQTPARWRHVAPVVEPSER